MTGFSVTVQRVGTAAVHVTVRGALDNAHAYRFDDAIRRLERDNLRCLIVDLRELDFVDATGIARLLAARRRARLNGHRLLLVRGSQTVQRIFAFAALEEHFEFISEPCAALATTAR